MDVEFPQGKVEERAGVGQPPLEEVGESPALERAQPLPLGLAPSEEIEDEIMQSPIGTGVCKEKTQKGDQDHQVTQEEMVEAQSDGDDQLGLLPSTAGSMKSQEFTQMSGEAPLVATPIENPTAYKLRGGSTTQSPSSGEEYTPKAAKKITKIVKKRKKGQSQQQLEKKQTGTAKVVRGDQPLLVLRALLFRGQGLVELGKSL